MTKILLTIPNVSTNRLYTIDRRNGRRILTKQARDTKEGWKWEAMSQYKGKPIEEELEVRIDLYFPDRRRRDGDNIKALLDAMTGVLWKDDSLIEAHMVRKHIVRGKDPKIIITFPCNLPA